MDIQSQLTKAIAPIVGRVRNMVARAVLSAVNDAAGIQMVKLSLLSKETKDGAERFQNYGFTSVPMPGAEGVALFVGGLRSHAVVVAMDDRRYRIKGLQAGEVAIYTDEGDSIVLKRGRLIEVTTDTLVVNATTKATFVTPLLECTGDIEAVGEIKDKRDAGGRTMSEMRDVYNSHTHPENDSGGPTDPPNQGM